MAPRITGKMKNTLQIGQREKLKVMRGPGHFFDRTERQQWAWKTCLQLSYMFGKLILLLVLLFVLFYFITILFF
jgi:hypothetical protein